MSGFAYPQPLFDSSTYNPAFYLSLDQSGFLTYAYAQTLYLSRNDYRLSYITGITQGTATPGIALVPGSGGDISGVGALNCNSLTVNGVSVSGPPLYVVGITPGTAILNKALVLGSAGEIATITSLTATNITGTLQSAAQPYITSLGTLSSLTVSGNISGTLTTAAQPNITSLGTLSSLNATSITGTLQTAAQPNITALGTLSSLTVSGNISGTLITAAQPNITSIGSLTSLTAGSITVNNITMQATSSVLNLSGGASLISIAGTSAATSSFTGCLQASGGIGVAGNSYFGNNLTVAGTTASTSTSTGAFQCSGGIGITKDSYFGNGLTFNGQLTVNSVCNFNNSIGVNSASGVLYITNVAASTSSTTGALRCSGGAYFGNDSYFAGNLTIDSTKKINAFIGYGDQSSITTLGNLTELAIGSVYPSTEYLRITGNGIDYLDGTYTRMCTFVGSNATPVIFQIEVSAATSANAAWIGNLTANDIRFGTNASTQMTLTSTGRLGIGSTNPLYGLYVGTTVTTTLDAGATGVAYFKQSGGLVSTVGPIASIPIAIACAGSMLSSTAYSDARLKHRFEAVEDTVCDGLLKVEPLLFNYKTDSDDTPLQIGYKAQDLIKAGLYHCINIVSNPDLDIVDEEVDLKGLQFTADYGKVSCLLHKLLIRQQ